MARQLTLVPRQLLGEPEGWPGYLPEFVQRVMAARGVTSPTVLDRRLARLHSPSGLTGVQKAASLIGDAIIEKKRIMIAGDYDCDGATGSAVAIRGLRLLGATDVDFIVPNRFKHGYGLSPQLVDDMLPVPDLVVTVDSGISNVEGVAHAKQKGMTVVITDHHLPGDIVPEADAIVNPNQKDCEFPSKSLAGVGVMFYTLLKVKQYLVEKGHFPAGRIPDLTELLDLVALGTVADLVPLDENNRILVHSGIGLVRQGRACIGFQALMASAKVDSSRLVASDIAFSVAPRLNAAGRLEDMRLGVQALISTDRKHADELVKKLEEINTERREIQADMVADAEHMVKDMEDTDAWGVVIFDKNWHSGIVGLVASKLKESLYRPVIALSPAEPGSSEVRGSARSVPGFHLRDALAIVDVRHPGLMKKFGGHAMAAGLSLDISKVEIFKKAFDEVAREILTEELLSPVIYTDGPLPEGSINLDTAHLIRSCGPWGQGFPEPIFNNTFFIQSYQTLGKDNKHLKFVLVDPRDCTTVDAIFFNGHDPNWEPQGYVNIAYELSVNVWRDNERLQLMVRYLEPTSEQ